MKQHHPLYQTLLDGMARYGAEPTGAVEETLGVPVERIRRHVVLAPWWEPSMFDPACFGRAEYISPVPNAETMVWEVESPQGEPLTFIKTHIGAPVCTDVALALGLTACEACLFIGSVGALDPAMRLGDIVVPESSVCGDGTSAKRSLRDAGMPGRSAERAAHPNRGTHRGGRGRGLPCGAQLQH